MRKLETVKKMKILYYNHSDEMSGAEISLLLTISHMPHFIKSVLAAPRGELLNEAGKRGIAIYPIKSFRARLSKGLLTTFVGVIGTFIAGLRLRKLVKEVNPDVVHANSIRAGLISVIGVFGKKKMLVWHVRDNLPNNIIGTLIRTVARFKVDAIIAISHAICRNFTNGESALRKKTMVVHNGVNTSVVGRPIRGELGTSEKKFVIGVVGQIAPWKRQVDAIRVYSQFVLEHPNSELWIVGEPKFSQENVDYMRKLKVLVGQLDLNQNIRFLGQRNDVMNVMHSIDVLLIPSENEPFGRVVIEAMLAGKPVVGTNSGGIPEIVLDEKTGLLYKVGSLETVHKKLGRLVAEEVAQKMGATGRARIKELFSINETCRKICLIYRRKHL